MLIYCSYCFLYLPRNVIQFSYDYHLMCYPLLCLSWWLLTGALSFYFWNYYLCDCGQTCVYMTTNIPLDPVLIHTSSSLFIILIKKFEVSDPYFLSHYVTGLQWWMLGFFCNMSMFCSKQSTGKQNTLLRTLLVPGCPVPKKNPVVILMHAWHAGNLLV